LTMSLPSGLEPLCARPDSSAVFLDFDGTLSPIVDDPALARPVDGVPALLAELGGIFGVVAVVSGRPAVFLDEHLGRPTGVRLIGLYGLEEVGQPTGPSVDSDALGRWRPVMERLADEAEFAAPRGVSVERKALAFTLHFRHAPEQEDWVRHFADEQRARRGVTMQPGRMAVELRPGIVADKGTVVRSLVAGCNAACCFGDDLGDLAAFAALGDLATEGLTITRVAVVDDESPRAVSDAADIVVEGPLGALALLRSMASAARR
jgi:trehalose 6-phosphate phosphatase